MNDEQCQRESVRSLVKMQHSLHECHKSLDRLNSSLTAILILMALASGAAVILFVDSLCK